MGKVIPFKPRIVEHQNKQLNQDLQIHKDCPPERFFYLQIYTHEINLYYEVIKNHLHDVEEYTVEHFISRTLVPGIKGIIDENISNEDYVSDAEISVLTHAYEIEPLIKIIEKELMNLQSQAKYREIKILDRILQLLNQEKLYYQTEIDNAKNLIPSKCYRKLLEDGLDLKN